MNNGREETDKKFPNKRTSTNCATQLQRQEISDKFQQREREGEGGVHLNSQPRNHLF